MDHVEPLAWEHREIGDVEPADLVAGIGGIEKAGIQVGGDHARARELGQQAGDAAAAGTHHQSAVASSDAGSEQAPAGCGIPGQLETLEPELLVGG